MNRLSRLGFLVLVVGSALSLVGVFRTSTPIVLIEQYLLIGPGSTDHPNSTRPFTIHLPPQTLRMEFTLNQGIGLDFNIYDYHNPVPLLSFHNISQINAYWNIPYRTVYNLTWENPYPTNTLGWFRITAFSIERDLFSYTFLLVLIGSLICIGGLINRHIKKQVKKQPENRTK